MGPRRNHLCRFLWLSLAGFGRGGGQILAFSTDLRRRPYNTLALPCKCVMYLVVCYRTTVRVCDVPGSMLWHYRASVWCTWQYVIALPCKCVMYLVVCYCPTVRVCDVPGSMLLHYRASVWCTWYSMLLHYRALCDVPGSMLLHKWMTESVSAVPYTAAYMSVENDFIVLYEL